MLSSQFVVYMSEVLTLVGVMFVDGIYSCSPRTISTLGTVPCINSAREFIRVHCLSAKLWLILTPSLICLVKGSRKNFMGSKEYSAFSPLCSIWPCLYRAFPLCFIWCAFACSFSIVYSVLPVSPWYTDFFFFLSSQVVHLMVYPAPPCVTFRQFFPFDFPLRHIGHIRLFLLVTSCTGCFFMGITLVQQSWVWLCRRSAFQSLLRCLSTSWSVLLSG